MQWLSLIHRQIKQIVFFSYFFGEENERKGEKRKKRYLYFSCAQFWLVDKTVTKFPKLELLQSDWCMCSHTCDCPVSAELQLPPETAQCKQGRWKGRYNIIWKGAYLNVCKVITYCHVDGTKCGSLEIKKRLRWKGEQRVFYTVLFWF
jgi:hypothetical protein